jgi:Fanconi anemia group M protein
MPHVSHPLIREGAVESRAYQEKILASIAGRHALVVLPTGLGKTIVAALLAAHVLSRSSGRVLFLAPTKPLVLQHAETLRSVMRLESDDIAVFTGATPPGRRAEGYGSARLVCATPQVVENDLVSRRLSLAGVSLLVIDEAHRATGDYAYVYIASRYHQDEPKGQLLGITASPGHDRKRVREVMDNLGVEVLHIEDESSPDVSPYVQEVEVTWVQVPFPPPLEHARSALRAVYDDKVTTLLKLRLTTKPRQYITKRDILDMGEQLRKRITQSSRPSGELFAGLKAQAAALKVSHALELLETQGPQAMTSYFEKMRSQRSKSAKELLEDPRIIEAQAHAAKHEALHPKIDAMKKILSQLGDGQKAIVFSQFRDTTRLIIDEIAACPAVKAVRFVGQSSRDTAEGLSQKQQKELLDAFRRGDYNVLVATSVAEEGLDIPSVDMVIFFEPVPSEIRTIQRRGRTGRKAAGAVYVLSTKGTMDEAYYGVAQEKERRMKTMLSRMGGQSAPAPPLSSAAPAKGQAQLDTFVSDGPAIVVDHRENPQMLKLLSRSLRVEPRQLEAGDYVIAGRIGVERKSAEDFVRSLFESRLFVQLKALKAAYENPLLIIEGEGALTKHDANASAIRAAVGTIATDLGIGIIMSSSMEETADYLVLLAKRSEHRDHAPPKLRGDKRERDLRSQQVFVLEGLPGVSATLARRLLTHFGSVAAVLAATREELTAVEGVGPATAARIRAVLDAVYAT